MALIRLIDALMLLDQAVAVVCAVMQMRDIISGIQSLWFAVNDEKVPLSNSGGALERCFHCARFSPCSALSASRAASLLRNGYLVAVACFMEKNPENGFC